MKSLQAMKLRQFILQQVQTDQYILLLHYSDNLTTTEISLVLDLAESFVANRLEQLQTLAKKQLQACKPAVKPASFHAMSLSVSA